MSARTMSTEDMIQVVYSIASDRGVLLDQVYFDTDLELNVVLANPHVAFWGRDPEVDEFARHVRRVIPGDVRVTFSSECGRDTEGVDDPDPDAVERLGREIARLVER